MRACNATLYRYIKSYRRLGAGPDDLGDTEDHGLYAFYDLDISPITFDICWFLVAAELDRQQRGLDFMHCVLVPGRFAGVREEPQDYETAVDIAARRRRIDDILIAALEFLPSCSGHTHCKTRAEAAALEARVARHIFPADYAVPFPVGYSAATCLDAVRAGIDIAVLRGTDEKRIEIREMLAETAGSRKIVTVTLRDYDYMPARNSDLEAWRDFAHGLDRREFFPVIVPDTASNMTRLREVFGDLCILDEAARDLGLRMALYEHSYLNLAVNTGPFILCWLNPQVRYIMFKIIVPDVPQATATMMRWHGFDIGKSPSFATPFQRWVWEDDIRSVIAREFKAMCTVIERHCHVNRG